MMSSLLRAAWRSRAVVILASIGACTNASAPDATSANAATLRYLMSDATTGGNGSFYFVPPTSDRVKYPGTSDNRLLAQLVVKICALPACAVDIATFSSSTSPAIKLAGNSYDL